MKPVSIVSMGSYHIGGSKVTIEGSKPIQTTFWPGGPPVVYDPNGDFQAGQMYVQYKRLEKPKLPYPVVMVHGGGASGALFETTQKGEPGWEFMFLQNGYNVDVVDGCERGRSSWAQFPEINEGLPWFNSYKERWTTYRLGPSYLETFKGSRFDYDKYDQFMKQHVPRWTSSNAMVQKAYDTYFESQKEGMIVLAHSQGGLFSLNAALKNYKNIKGVILVESSSTMDPMDIDCHNFLDIPFLFVYGDFLKPEYEINGYVWPGSFAYKGSMRNLHTYLKNNGGDSTWMELPDLGIYGNTHALMLEDNSRQIADLICQWMDEHIKK